MRASATLRPIDALRVPSLLAFLKLGIFLLHALVFLSSHSLLWVLVRNERARLRLIVRSNGLHARLVATYLNLEAFHEEGAEKVRGKLIICNHQSWVDVIVLFTRYPALFITSREIGETPFLGQITRLAGCFFVERRKELRTPEMALEEMRQMRRRLSEGFNIFLFPEGTSSDGTSLLPFKAHFFQLAIEAKVFVQPLVIKYLGAGRSVAPWYGDMDFLPHFLNVCRQRELSVTVLQLPKLSSTGKEKFALKDEAHSLIKEAYEAH